jgi:hypothetical protein
MRNGAGNPVTKLWLSFRCAIVAVSDAPTCWPRSYRVR